jgi:signal peptidase I
METAAATSKPNHPGGAKETIESILVAFILAFVFRAFVFEAFVIPTGSMATTLLGAHTRFECPDCGYKFDLNYQSAKEALNESDEGEVPDRAQPITTPIYCPNCGFQMPENQTGKPGRLPNDPPQIPGPQVFYGDRILVLKYLYLFNEPRRWDVVVFKPPTNLSQNFIKRLVGKPGEAVMILDGCIYIRSPGDPDPRHFVVQPKPPDVQPAMWRLVYDNDFHPQMLDRGNLPRWQQPWQPAGGSGWNQTDPATGGRAFLFSNPSGDSTLKFSPEVNTTAQTLSDYLVHDQNTQNLAARMPGAPFPQRSDIPVSDLDLRATYERLTGSGPLELKLTKRQHRFRAVVLPASAALFDDVDGKSVQVGSTYPLPPGTDPVRIELSNADYHAVLQVNGKIVAETTPANYAPDLQELLDEYDRQATPPVGVAEFTADKQSCRLSHVSLWRDLYYYNHDVSVLQNILWATPKDFPKNVQQLGPDEFFTMGDNSLVSFDARLWPDRSAIHLPAEDLDVGPGRVPGRFLLGKAFYVYWPAGHSVSPTWPALVPNFGSMRFIH